MNHINPKKRKISDYDEHDDFINSMFYVISNKILYSNILNYFVVKKWNRKRHKVSSPATKKTIETLFILNMKDSKTKEPLYKESLIYLLPKELLPEIFKYLSVYDSSKMEIEFEDTLEKK